MTVLPPVSEESVEREKGIPHKLQDHLTRQESVGAYASVVVHLLLLLLLALLAIHVPQGFSGPLLIGGTDDLPSLMEVSPEEVEASPVDIAELSELVPSEISSPTVTTDVTGLEFLEEEISGQSPQKANPFASLTAQGDPIRKSVLGGGGLEGRTPSHREFCKTVGDSTRESELAVEAGLNWLAAHQLPDGGWSFQLSEPPCRGRCRHSGTHRCRTAATAVALLPFLGAGYTHLEGKHKRTIDRGLYFLVQNAVYVDSGYDLQQGSMYGQGLATLALSEAYAMSRTSSIKQFAQGSLDFIDAAQDKRGGGWRYTPGAPGDTTVTGWQFMALKSGLLASLDVKPQTVYLVDDFLNSVQYEGGSRYAYLPDIDLGRSTDSLRTTTSIGLLLRMYLGWYPGHRPLDEGVAKIERWGPSEKCMYYNYYAALVLHHYGGSGWERWYPPLREYLVKTQAKRGHEAGSWYFPDRYADEGGRLFNTALAIMILEVPYRYMPLYRLQQ